MTDEEEKLLLEYAKKNYPVWTEFLGSMAGKSFDKKCIVTNDNYYVSDTGVSVDADRPSEKVRRSGTYIYYEGKWAEIINKKEKQELQWLIYI